MHIKISDSWYLFPYPKRQKLEESFLNYLLNYFLSNLSLPLRFTSISCVIITKKVLSLFVNNLPGALDAQNNNTNNSKLCYMSMAFSNSVS